MKKGPIYQRGGVLILISLIVVLGFFYTLSLLLQQAYQQTDKTASSQAKEKLVEINLASPVNNNFLTSYTTSLPSGFPDLPLPENVSLQHSQSLADEAGQIGYSAEWYAPQTIPELRNFFSVNLPLQGWEIIQPFEGQETVLETSLVAKKGNLKLHMTVETKEDSPNRGQTVIEVEFPTVVSS